MNLVEKSWIPVVKMDGIKTEASLHDIFCSGEGYAELAVRPHERVALMRFLICIAQAALDGPENFEQWENVPKILAEKVVDYFYAKKWKEAFELFDPKRPFLQISELAVPKSEKRNKEHAAKSNKKKSKTENPIKLPSTCTMDFSLATGNNATLFDHRGNDFEARPLPEGCLALNLVTFQNFSSGGGASIAEWKSVKFKQVGNPDAPCLKGSMYHAFLKGFSIAETIHLNLLTKKNVGLVFGNENWGKPVWEMMPFGPDDAQAITNATQTYLGRLVPISRWIKLLDPSWMIWGRGFTYPVFADSKNPFRCPEPSATSIEEKDEHGQPTRDLLKANHARGIWRHLAALTVKRRAGNVGGALALSNIPDDKDYDIHVCALLRKQATIEAYQESIFHVPAGMNTDIGRAAYEDEVAFAEAKARRLGRAVERWRKEMDADWSQKLKAAGKDKRSLQERLRSIATNHFWTAMEKNVPLLLAYTASLGQNDNDRRKKLWRWAVHRSARNAYKLACGRESPRQIRAFAIGLRELEREEAQNNENKEE